MTRDQLILSMRAKFNKRVLDNSLKLYDESLKHKAIVMAMMYGASPAMAYKNCKKVRKYYEETA